MKPRPDPSTKPYSRCLSCGKFRKSCGGKPTRDLTLSEWCEYICDVMDLFHIQNANVAKGADVSVKTIERIRAGNCEQDLMRGTARRVEQFILGPVGEHPCPLEQDDSVTSEKMTQMFIENQNLKRQVEFLLSENERKSKIIDKYLAD